MGYRAMPDNVSSWMLKAFLINKFWLYNAWAEYREILPQKTKNDNIVFACVPRIYLSIHCQWDILSINWELNWI